MDDGKGILYVGHDDGALVKWSLEEHRILLSKQINSDGTEDFERHLGSFLLARDTPGVAGLIVCKHTKTKGRHLLYSWSNIYEGFPDIEFDDWRPVKVKVCDERELSETILTTE